MGRPPFMKKDQDEDRFPALRFHNDVSVKADRHDHDQRGLKMSSPDSQSRAKILGALSCAAVAALLLWAAVTDSQSLNVPPAIAYVAAWVFGAGAGRLLQLAHDPKSPGDAFAVLICAGMATIAFWIAVGSGARECTGGIAYGTAAQTTGAACRIPFGIGGLLVASFAVYAAFRWFARRSSRKAA